VGRVDSLRVERGDGAIAMGIVPDLADHADAGAGAGGGDGLVRPLAAVMGREAAAQHRLAGQGKPIGGYHEIDVDGADDDDMCAHRRSMPDCTARRALP
jgi:hypothetical protein